MSSEMILALGYSKKQSSSEETILVKSTADHGEHGGYASSSSAHKAEAGAAHVQSQCGRYAKTVL